MRRFNVQLRWSFRPVLCALGLGVVLHGCVAPGSGLGQGVDTGWGSARRPGSYAQDSATSGCLRNPACYTTPPGEEAIIPWLVRSADFVRTATTAMRLLEGAELARVKTVLVRCAQRASQDVNAEDDVLRGRNPSAEECKKVIRQEKGRDVTRAMELGRKKHSRALECARLELGKLFPGNVSVEPRYQRDPDTGGWLWLDPGKVKEWVELGLTHHLLGSLVPDIVIHASGNPNQNQNIFDFKFTCPAEGRPTWTRHGSGHPHHPKSQGEMYKEALLRGREEPRFATPEGVQ